MPKVKTGSRLANYTTEAQNAEASPLINQGSMIVVIDRFRSGVIESILILIV